MLGGHCEYCPGLVGSRILLDQYTFLNLPLRTAKHSKPRKGLHTFSSFRPRSIWAFSLRRFWGVASQCWYFRTLSISSKPTRCLRPFSFVASRSWTMIENRTPYASFTLPSSSERLVPLFTSAWPSHHSIVSIGFFSSPDLKTLMVHCFQYIICPDPTTEAPMVAPSKKSSALVRVSRSND